MHKAMASWHTYLANTYHMNVGMEKFSLNCQNRIFHNTQLYTRDWRGDWLK